MNEDDGYQLIRGDDYNDSIEGAVNRAMREGWEPLGGVVFLGYRDGVARFAQAMVRVQMMEVKS